MIWRTICNIRMDVVPRMPYIGVNGPANIVSDAQREGVHLKTPLVERTGPIPLNWLDHCLVIRDSTKTRQRHSSVLKL
jgi:hypothetical protein